MRKLMIAALAVLLLCSGCANEDRTGRVDTVVWIPVNPTETPTEYRETEIAATEISETEAATEPTEPDSTAETEKPASGGKKPSGSKKPYGSSTAKATEPKETKPKETKPKETEPIETEPEMTNPPAAEPAPTEPEMTEPPVTEPAGSEPADTEPSETESAATEPEMTEPEMTETEPTEPPLYDISGYKVGSLEYGIFEQINEAREDSKLNLDSRLCAIASCRANEISREWSHTRPDGRHYATVLTDYGYSAGTVSELLVYAAGDGNAAEIVGKWLESDSHRQILLSSGYHTVGIGVYRSGGYTYICCLVIG